jgi:hypothetical protein
MLAQAKEKHLYDDLVKRELTEYLRDHAAAFDLIISGGHARSISATYTTSFGRPRERCDRMAF